MFGKKKDSKTELRTALEILLQDYADANDFDRAIQFLEFSKVCAQSGVKLHPIPKPSLWRNNT